MPIPICIGLAKLAAALKGKSAVKAGHSIAKGAHGKSAGRRRKKKDGPELEVEVEAGDEGDEDGENENE
jgi:hypothetical protein